MAAKQTLEAQNPLILRCNRLIEAFAKSDDERDFYLDRYEGFLVYVDLDKETNELSVLEKELQKNHERYCMIPKLTFYETKKIMEGFINEKVYDIDTKEKLLDIIQSKEARENFLEFIYDHHSELEKWQSFYQERSRIRIIEWLRINHFHFVFEEDLELPKSLLEKLKKDLFQAKAGKEILAARKALFMKSKTYYSNEALNPRPKRGRPPKQAQKAEIEPQLAIDIYTTVPNGLRGFLFTPDLNSPSSATFSSKFGNEEDLFANRRLNPSDNEISVESLTQKLAALKSLSTKWVDPNEGKKAPIDNSFDMDDEDDEDDDFDADDVVHSKGKKLNGKKPIPKPQEHLSKKLIPAPKKSGRFMPKAKPSAKLKPKLKLRPKLALRPKGKLKPKVILRPKPAKMSAKKMLRPIVRKKVPLKKLKPLSFKKLKVVPKRLKAAPPKAKTPAPKKAPPPKKKAFRPMMKLKLKKKSR